jgi:hypothetical protein
MSSKKNWALGFYGFMGVGLGLKPKFYGFMGMSFRFQTQYLWVYGFEFWVSNPYTKPKFF